MRFLSAEWFEAMDLAAGTVEVPAEIQVSVAQIVTDAPGGELRWVLICEDGTCRIERSGSATATVTLCSNHATALAMATGRLAASRAVLGGDLTIGGDPMHLVTATAALDLLGPAFAAVGEKLDA
ncbi:MAG: SCP2 sterol-binding domain-containing protein [Microthrixaceae bacterium]|nr:SCP2 sterol-binding domain-containing protein [Microthrixaceae bacterium]